MSTVISNPKEIILTNDWTLVAHESISAYVSLDDSNKFAIHDWDDDQMLILITEERSIDFQANRYDLKHKINLFNRTIHLFAEPDEDE